MPTFIAAQRPQGRSAQVSKGLVATTSTLGTGRYRTGLCYSLIPAARTSPLIVGTERSCAAMMASTVV